MIPTVLGGQYDCPICLERFQWGESIITLPCRHKFHQACIEEWSSRARTCPACRGAFFGRRKRKSRRGSRRKGSRRRKSRKSRRSRRFGASPPCLICSKPSCQTVLTLDPNRFQPYEAYFKACKHGGAPNGYFYEEHYCRNHEIKKDKILCIGEKILKDC
jgi:hypothetical protein